MTLSEKLMKTMYHKYEKIVWVTMCVIAVCVCAGPSTNSTDHREIDKIVETFFAREHFTRLCSIAPSIVCYLKFSHKFQSFCCCQVQCIWIRWYVSMATFVVILCTVGTCISPRVIKWRATMDSMVEFLFRKVNFSFRNKNIQYISMEPLIWIQLYTDIDIHEIAYWNKINICATKMDHTETVRNTSEIKTSSRLHGRVEPRRGRRMQMIWKRITV